MAQRVRNMPAMWETWVRKIPLEKGMATHTIFLPEEFHEQRRLEGYSPRGSPSDSAIPLLNIYSREEHLFILMII